MFCLADLNAPLPEGVNPIDVAALVKCFLASLPQPLISLELHNEVRGARSSIPMMRNILKKLPTVNYMTLELITALLLRVSQKSLLNKALTLPPSIDLHIIMLKYITFPNYMLT